MRKYKTLLFDIDNTLLDFDLDEKWALTKLFNEQSISLTSEMIKDYKKINTNLWKSFEEGTIDRNEVLNNRFAILFKKYGKEIEGSHLDQKYRHYLEQGHHLVKGAYELIRNLQKHFDLYIVTNGVSKTQYKRLYNSGLYPFFKNVFVSEDIGYPKPMKQFFDFVFSKIPHFNVEQALIIGDSLSADIQGGNQAGIDTCWFNPQLKLNDTGIIPTYQIQKLDELYHIVKSS